MFTFMTIVVYQRSLSLMRKDEHFCRVKDKMKRASSQGSPQKIQELIHVVDDHFSK
jgi:hypothetical protein